MICSRTGIYCWFTKSYLFLLKNVLLLRFNIIEIMPTKFIEKMNKTEAGFHLLMILSYIDGTLHSTESSVIIDFIEKNYKENLDIIKEQAFIRALPGEELHNHFHEIAAQFYKISTYEERNKLIEFAMKVVMADDTMEHSENTYINQLYDAWDLA